jgi:hypothetical protein
MQDRPQLSIGQSLKTLWESYPYCSFHKDFKTTMESLVIQFVENTSPDSFSFTKYTYTLQPQYLKWLIPLEITSCTVKFTGEILLDFLYDKQSVEYTFGTDTLDSFAFQTVDDESKMKANLSPAKLLRLVKPETTLDLSWLPSAVSTVFGIDYLNFSTGAFRMTIYPVVAIFKTKNIDLHVIKISITQKEIQIIGRVHSLLTQACFKFYENGAELEYYDHDIDYSKASPLSFEESTFPSGAIPKGIFRSVPEMFQNSAIRISSFRSKLDLNDNFAFIFDRYYYFSFSLIDLRVNAMPDLFPRSSKDYNCVPGIISNSICIEWGVFAPILSVVTFHWIVRIKYLTDQFGMKAAEIPEYTYGFNSLYRTWVLHYTPPYTPQTTNSGNLTFESLLLRHILELNMKYDFSSVLTSRSCIFGTASINLKFNHFDLHEVWRGDPSYCIEFDYWSGWRSGALQWRLTNKNDMIGKCKGESSQSTLDGKINRIVLFEKDFRGDFMMKLMKYYNRGTNLNFAFQ